VDRHAVAGHRLLRRSYGVRVDMQHTVEAPAVMNAFIIVIAVLCSAYLVYAMLRPERF
jgi:K+-transporting ATPase KdpF subunit